MQIERNYGGLQPIRAEIFSAERLEQHAKSLASAQPVGKPLQRRKSLRRSLNENSAHLVIAFRKLAKAAQQGQQITSAGEWFLDNFHIVEEQIRKAQSDLPADFYSELPKLIEGPLAGYPRVYGISWALIAHTDGAFDLDRLERFVRAYQEIVPLNIGELWAIAITLRITLVENLRRLIEIVADRLDDGARAEVFAQQVLSGSPNGPVPSFSDPGKVSAIFITRVEQRLRSQNAAADAVLVAIEAQLRNQDTSSDALIQQEYQLQGADDISVRNVINAMRLVSNIDWAEFFENVSLTDQALRNHPGYQKMDFPTRDRYRRAVEKLGRRAPMDEIAIATAAVHEGDLDPQAPARQRDPGYYLIGKGRHAFEEKIGYRPSWRQRFWRSVRAMGLPGYLLFLGLTAGLILLLALAAVTSLHLNADILPLLVFVGFVPASDLATALVNRVVTNRWAPEILPALSLKEGVPDFLSTVLVVPVLLTSSDQVRDQVAGLEIHYLSNPDARLQFILLSDWADSDSEDMPGDADLLQRARRHCGIERPLCAQRSADFHPPAPPPPVESGTGPLDGVGAQARKAARTEPAAARRGRHKFSERRTGPQAAAAGRAVRHHPGCRYQTSARRRQAPDREDGASPEPARI